MCASTRLVRDTLLCCTVRLEQSPCSVVKHTHIFEIIFEMSLLQAIPLTLCVCVCVCVCVRERERESARARARAFQCGEMAHKGVHLYMILSLRVVYSQQFCPMPVISFSFNFFSHNPLQYKVVCSSDRK